MLGEDFDAITLGDIERLIEIGAPEGRSIEYKAQHYGHTDADKREFVADICAFANAVGGDLIIGVSAVDGIPVSVDGVEAANPDKLKLQIQQSIQANLEPELVGCRVKWLQIQDDRGVFLIRVPRGWNGPHRVRANAHFFMRNENGKYPMSVTQIRDSFLLSGRIEDQIESLRAERAELIKRNELPVQTPDGAPYLLFHLMPRQSLLDRVDINPTPESVTIAPLGAQGANYFYSVDGVVFYSGEWTKYAPKGACTTVFRNGVVEAVLQLGTYEKHSKTFVQINALERELVQGLPQMVDVVRRAGLPAPFYACLSILNIRGMCGRYAREDNDGLFYPYRRDDLTLPPLLITGDDKASVALRPLFEMVWNAFGQPGSPNYDREGRWSV